MKYLFIVNPAAGGKKSRYKKTISAIREVMAGSGKPFEIYVTKAPMDACGKVSEEADLTDSLIVFACGGDGTLNECVNGAVGRENVTVTHFPTGTGNDFIKMFGDEKDRFCDLKELLDGETRKIDVIECNKRYSINICSVGIDARIGTDVHKYSRLPIIGGPTGYVVSLVVNVAKGISTRLRVTTAGGQRSDDFTLICVCNGRFYGGGFNPVPDAMPDDGILDILLVGKTTRIQFFGFVGKYANGRFREWPERIKYERGRAITVESADTLVVNVDGEAIYGRKIYFKVVPGAVNFLFPKNLRFFNNLNMKNSENSRTDKQTEEIGS